MFPFPYIKFQSRFWQAPRPLLKDSIARESNLHKQKRAMQKQGFSLHVDWKTISDFILEFESRAGANDDSTTDFAGDAKEKLRSW